MAKIQITREALLRGKIVTPDWYPCEIVSVDEHLSKAGDSINWDVDHKILDGPFKDVVVRRVFNEKAPGFAIDFLKAFDVEIDEEVGGEFDMHAAKGKKCMVEIKTEMYLNRPKNVVNSYRPL